MAFGFTTPTSARIRCPAPAGRTVIRLAGDRTWSKHATTGVWWPLQRGPVPATRRA
jgi:hypothetical protein